jgi:hypothetical protein
LGTEAEPFTGTLRGNGKTITLASFSPAALQGKYIGVLGYVSGAKVEDLTLSLGFSSQTTIGMTGDQIAGGLAAHALRSEFTGIRAEGALNLGKSDRRLTAGGIVGILERSTIRNSVSTVALTGKVTNSTSASGIYAGGIAARAALSAIFTSRYEGTLNISSGSTTVGGIAGVLEDHRSSQPKYGGDFGIYDCSASGAITAMSHGYAGGIAGTCNGSAYNPGIITRCAAKINVTGTVAQISTMSTPFGYAGGVVATMGNYGIITDSYSTGNVTLSSGYSSIYAGGIAGNPGFGKISRCYASGIVSVQSNSAYSPYFQNDPSKIYSGGIAGLGGSSIENCAALNGEIRLGKYSIDGVPPRRIGDTGKGGTLSGNIANRDMTFTITKHSTETPDPPAMEKTADGMDGEDCDPKPAAGVFTAMGWDFGSVWKMGADGYPALAWEQ